MKRHILNIAILLFVSHSIIGQSWLSPWENRQSLSITNYNYLEMTDYQTRLEIEYTDGMQADFSDLRFTNSSGNTTLPYWIEHFNPGVKAVVWVKVDYIVEFGTADFFLYYSNPAATSASDPNSTFIFYDDFDNDTGWNDIGSTPSTGLTMLDSVTSVIQKYDECGSDGAWKSLGDTISSFKFITRDFMPADSDTDCTINEYGIETADFKGVNLRRDGMDTGSGSEYGLELRDGDSTSQIITDIVDQPVGKWYRTTLSYAFPCHLNMHTMMFTDDMDVIGNVYGETFSQYEFDRFTMRGGHTYNLDYLAVAKHFCVWPVVVFNPEIETCPQGTLVEFENDLCEEGLGLITINVAGGIAPYTVTWFDGQDSLGSIVMDTIGTMTIDSLNPGNYCFKIVDAEGCVN